MPLSHRENLLQTPCAAKVGRLEFARRPHRRGRCHRTHPAPPRIVGSRCARGRRPRATRTRRAGDPSFAFRLRLAGLTMARRSIPRLRPRTGVRRKLRTPAAARCALEARISSLPPRQTRHFGVRGAPRTPKCRALDSQSPIFDSQNPIWQHPGMEIKASSFKLRANAPKGQKRFPISKISF